MKLEISNWNLLKKYCPHFVLSKKDFADILNRELSVYGVDELSIVFIDEEYIHMLNREYRSIDSVTDVLSFNIDSKPLIGEVYICPDFIKSDIEFDLQEEILRCVVHGFLHILGYDHKDKFNEKNYKQEDMFVKQENILQNILYEINSRTRKSR